MRPFCTKFFRGAVALVFLQVASAFAPVQGAPNQDQVSQKVTPSTPVTAVLPLPPLETTTPNQTPLQPVVVTAQEGELIVEANDAPLYDILRAISAKTGARIDLPPRANVRMTRHIGPAPIGEIVDSLLNGFGLNYVIEGWAQPGAVRVIFLSEGNGSLKRQMAMVQSVETSFDPQQLFEARRQMNEQRQMSRQAIMDRLKAR